MNANTLCVVGLGYIGLPTAVVFALAGKQVVGIDIQPEIVAQLNQSQLHFSEPALAEGLRQAVHCGRFIAKSTPEAADAFIIAVPTPLNVDQTPDLSYVKAAVINIAPVLENGNLIVLESTSPVGTTEQIAAQLQQLRPDLTTLHIAYCPERVLPGKIMQEIYQNDRIIGGLTPQATEYAIELYQTFCQGLCIPTNARIAELCKLAENSFRDVNIAFANELSMICEKLNVNVWALIALANRHPRVNILQPGVGVGGHCIAVDPYFIIHQVPEQAKLIHTARAVNISKQQWVLNDIKLAVADYSALTNQVPNRLRIACLGLSFKADVGDLRESPAMAIVEQLIEWHSGDVWVVEPHIAELPVHLQKKAEFVPLEQAITAADILVVLVDHSLFKSVESHQVQHAHVIDYRGIWSDLSR